MFKNTNTKKLIIVCTNNKTKEFANYLMALISQKNNTSDKITGVRNGSVKAVVYTEKEYLKRQPDIPSSQHIIFIGKSILTNAACAHMETRFCKYGMVFESLGTRARMYVDKNTLNSKEYAEFLDYAKSYEKTLDKAKKNILGKIPAFIDWAAILFAPLIILPVPMASLINKSKYKSIIFSQQYTCLTLKVYLEELSKFLEG